LVKLKVAPAPRLQGLRPHQKSHAPTPDPAHSLLTWRCSRPFSRCWLVYLQSGSSLPRKALG
jgi:hypothetical protein